MLQTKFTTSQTTEYVAMDIGPNKDNYAIEAFFRHNLFTDEITVKYRLIKNWIHNERVEGKVYKKETKFREVIAVDTYQKLHAMVVEMLPKKKEELITN